MVNSRALTNHGIRAEFFKAASAYHADSAKVVSGSVYLLEYNGAFKVGYAKDVKKRLRTMCEIVMPHRFYVVYAIECLAPHLTERMIHERLEAHRIRGEWFELDQRNLLLTMLMMVSYSQCELPVRGQIRYRERYSECEVELIPAWMAQYGTKAA